MKNQRKNPSNPLVFLDITVSSQPVGRILLELFADDVPKVCLKAISLQTQQPGICLCRC